MSEIEIAIPPKEPRRIVGKHFKGRKLNDASFFKTHFIDCSFTDIAISNGSVIDCHFENCRFTNIALQAGNIENSTFRGSHLHNIEAIDLTAYRLTCVESQWRQLQLTDCHIEVWLLAHCQMELVRWQNLELSYLTVPSTAITDLKMTGGSLQDASWYDTKLSQTDWQGVSLLRQVMGCCTLNQVRYQQITADTVAWSRCELTQTELRKLPLQYANFHKSQLKECWLDGSNLETAQFSEATLENCDLSLAQLSGARLVDAKLTGCNLEAANLQQASLLRAQLEHCNLTQVNLSRADLRSCCLHATSLQACKISSTRLHGAQLQPLDTPFSLPDPLLTQIDSWYELHQPGPQSKLTISPIPSGASRYV